MIDGAIYKDDKVILRYYQPVPKYVKVNGKEYVCDVKNAVSILPADEEDVPALLGVKGGCCGGQRLVFSLCSQVAYNVWETGNY